ncbi:MAG: zinc ribbon domain-containing protein [Promethearchaeota archaeon]
MIEDDSYDYFGEPQEPSTSPGRWIVFVLLLILGSVTVFGSILTAPPDVYLMYVVLLLPMVVLLLYAAYRWAQGRPIAPTNLDEDRRILATMHAHALPAEHVGGMEMYRCPDCGLSFELSNATPVDDKVVLCPFCKTRLYIE